MIWLNFRGGVIARNICKKIDRQSSDEVSKMVVSSLNVNNVQQFYVSEHNPFDDQILASFSVPDEGLGSQCIWINIDVFQYFKWCKSWIYPGYLQYSGEKWRISG